MADTTLPGSYASVGDFTQAATGIDPSSLKAGELARVLLRSSRRVDKICRQILYATVDVAVLREDSLVDGYAIDNTDGGLKLFPRNFPIRSITSLVPQFSPLDLASPLTNPVTIFPRYAIVDGVWFAVKHRVPPMYLVMTYGNGWAVTQLSAQANSGQPVATMKPQPGQATVQGFTPGLQVEFQDATPEVMTVLSVAGNAVTFSGNLTQTHLADTMVAPLDFADAQQATLLIAQYLIKSRGVAPLVIKNESVSSSGKQGPQQDLLAEAEELLADFTVHI